MSLLERIQRIEEQRQEPSEAEPRTARSAATPPPAEPLPPADTQPGDERAASTRDFTQELQLLSMQVESSADQRDRRPSERNGRGTEEEQETPHQQSDERTGTEEPGERTPAAGKGAASSREGVEPGARRGAEDSDGSSSRGLWQALEKLGFPGAAGRTGSMSGGQPGKIRFASHEAEPDESEPVEMPEPDEEDIAKLRLRVHERLIDRMPPQLLEEDHTREQVQQEVCKLARALLAQESVTLSEEQQEHLLREIIDEVYGLGPIEELIRDPEVTEIMVNGPHQVFVERRGLIERTSKRFQDDEHLIRVIQRIVAPINRRLDETNPMVDGRLPDGSRVNAILPPVSLSGPILTIHKFYKESFTAEDLLELGSLNEAIVDFLEACILARQDILICGGTSTGKTTMLNMLSSYIPHTERLITIEDAAELKLNQEHVITLEARPAGVAGRGEITIRDLVRNALRMRPDRIIIGEVRGPEALDMLQAMNTGHEGSMCTIHANSPYDVISRLETMVMMTGMDLPERTIREQIASAIDIIVHMGRLPDGSRRVMRVSEVQGIEDGRITLQDLFIYRRQGYDEHGQVVGRFEHTGVKPSFWDAHYPRP